MPRAVKATKVAAPDPALRRSTYRQEQAAATRDRIERTARILFADKGYGATTMEAIAEAAGVATRTVYAVFGAKREILSAICERWLEEAQVRLVIGTALAEPDPGRRMRWAAYWLRSLYQSGFDVVLLFEAAMVEDQTTRDLLRAKLAGRNEALDMLMASFGDALILPLASAQAVLRALAAPGIYQELVIESGWTPLAFEDWVAESLCRQLLGLAAPPHSDITAAPA